MLLNKYLGKKIPLFFLFLLIPSVHSFYVVDNTWEIIQAIPNKTYTDEICIGNLNENSYYHFIPNINNKIIHNFTIENEFLQGKKNRELCTKYSFSTYEYNFDNTSTNSKITVFESSNDSINLNTGFNIGRTKIIRLDTQSMTYKNALLIISKKFVLVFVSIFVLMSLLLYIIKNNKLNE